MKRSTHLAIGAAVTLPLMLNQEPRWTALGVAMGVLGAALPDWIDFHSGLRGPFRPQHRGVSHSLFALIVCIGVAWFVLSSVARVLATGLSLPISESTAALLTTAVAAGFGSHLLADACTPAGIAPLLPLSRDRLWILPRRFRGKTGGRLDESVRWLAWGLIGFSLVIGASKWITFVG